MINTMERDLVALDEFRVHINDEYDEAKIVWYVGGIKYAMRLSLEDYESLEINEKETVKKVTF